MCDLKGLILEKLNGMIKLLYGYYILEDNREFIGIFLLLNVGWWDK